MKTEWDYTNLAEAYLKRPDYAQAAIDELLKISSVRADDKVCDVGAGVAHLTLLLAKAKLRIKAVEPNDAMRKYGTKRTATLKNVSWFEGTAEATGQSSETFKLVTFGSSFNVCDRQQALIETSRILVPGGWFACMWNHRILTDPTQAAIETLIKKHLPHYDYGIRRQDQVTSINSSGLFGLRCTCLQKLFICRQKTECVEAWRSHATLKRQSGPAFDNIISDIEKFIFGLGADTVKIPYSTKVWVAQKMV